MDSGWQAFRKSKFIILIRIMITSQWLKTSRNILPFPASALYQWEMLHSPARVLFLNPQQKMPSIPHTYIILYRVIYLIPVYICFMEELHIYTLEQVWWQNTATPHIRLSYQEKKVDFHCNAQEYVLPTPCSAAIKPHQFLPASNSIDQGKKGHKAVLFLN